MSFEEWITRWAMGKRFLPVLVVALILSISVYLLALVSPVPQFFELPSVFLCCPSFFLCLFSLFPYADSQVNLRDAFFSQLRAPPLRSVLVGLIAVGLLLYVIVAWINFAPLGIPKESNGQFLLVTSGRNYIIKAELSAPEFHIYQFHYYHAEDTAFLSSAVFFSFMAIILKMTAKITKDQFALPDWANRT